MTAVQHKQTVETVTAFRLKNEVFRPKKILRWHIIAGLCLIHGFRNGAELGVSQGRFTLFLCSVMHDMKMFCADMWAEHPENINSPIPGAEVYEGWKHEENFQKFSQLAKDYFPDRISINRMDSAEAALLVLDGSLDFVFIDADHTYEGCKRDIEAWSPKVRKGGMISGHDYHQIKWPGVVQAVDEAFDKKFIADDMVWVHFKK